MTFQFGSFQLDEPGRALRLAERELPMQPRVFDLLVYLVRNRARVVSKDELLDALWPGVTVTDNSLQRAISVLRGVLREGAMEDAIRSFPRNGYRFCLDAEAPAAAHADAPDGIAAARQAIAEQRWKDAIALYAGSEASPSALTRHDLDNNALAFECSGKPADAIPFRMRATTLHSQAGDSDAAMTSAIALVIIHFERGDVAVARGWLARAQDFVAERPESPNAGLVLYAQARLTAHDGDTRQALALSEAAYESGHRHGNVKVESLGLMYRGFYRLSLGDTRAGLADQDHAAALALSSDIDPVTGGTLYCNILWACRTFGDWARANQWTLGYQQFCSDSGMQFTGSCQLHRAEVLGLRGSLRDALAHINDSLARLPGDAPWALGDAHRVLGDLHLAIGNTDEASSAYEKSYALGWDPQPGHAWLQLESGDAEGAFAALERSLAGRSWWTMQRRGLLLACLAVVAVHAGRPERAQALIDELAGQDERWPMPSIRALTNEASALLAQGRGDTDEALRRLHLARQLWTSIDCRLNAARLRVFIARTMLDNGDRSGATTEIRAALTAAEELDSRRLKEQCRLLMERT